MWEANLADISDGLQRRLLAHLRALRVGDVAYQGLQERWPEVEGQLHDRDVLHALRGRRRPVTLGAQRAQDVVLDVGADVLRHLQRNKIGLAAG